MINISEKKANFRRAIAQGEIFVGPEAFELIKNRQLPKGDALILAEIAGISGAKKAYEWIPLCHPLGLEHVSLYLELREKSHSVCVYCVASATAKTGVEMEALAGVNAALLTLYDLTKMVQPALTLSNIRLLTKEGGKSGLWTHPDGVPDFIQDLLPKPLKKLKKKSLQDVRTAIITVSDRASTQEYEDISGKLLVECAEALGADICNYAVIPDEKEQLSQHIRQLIAEVAPQLIMTTGGTGMAPRDITPEVLQELCDRIIPGFGEVLRYESAKYYTEFSWLSRCLAGSINNTLIIALPGRPKAVQESMDILKNLFPHAFTMLNAGNHDA
jgi:molybdenum cofactor biosynthesis protein MoaC